MRVVVILDIQCQPPGNGPDSLDIAAGWAHELLHEGRNIIRRGSGNRGHVCVAAREIRLCGADCGSAGNADEKDHQEVCGGNR